MSVAHPDPDRLVLAALPAEPHDPEMAEHLAGCASCRAHIAALRHTVDLARIEHTEIATPPARVWQAIADELGESAVPPESEVGGPTEQRRPAEHGTVVRLDGQRPAPPRTADPNRPVRRRPRWRALGIPIAAAVAGIAAGIAIGYALAPATPPPDALLATLQPISAADPTATGTVDGLARNGTQQLVIRINGVTDTVGGDYLEAWLLAPDGTRLVSLGALTRTSDGQAYQGEFTVPGNLPMSEFNTVDISAERWDGDPTHSRISLLRGSMT
jgi:Anti-sigma-K factor rskA